MLDQKQFDNILEIVNQTGVTVKEATDNICSFFETPEMQEFLSWFSEAYPVIQKLREDPFFVELRKRMDGKR